MDASKDHTEVGGCSDLRGDGRQDTEGRTAQLLRAPQQAAPQRDMMVRIGKVFGTAKVDAILLYNPSESPTSNFLYLTGFTSGIFERDALVVTQGGATLLTNPLEYETAKNQKPKGMDIETDGARTNTVLESLRGKTVGVDGRVLPHNDYVELERRTGAKFVDVSDSFTQARVVKDAEEIANMRKATEIIRAAIEESFNVMRVGMTEKELAAEVEYRIRQHGGDGTSFPSIVCFGKNTAEPHHMPDDTKLEPNSMVILDCGAKYSNYCSDVTRTVIFQPDPATQKYRQMQEIIDTVKKAQDLAMAEIREGATGTTAYLAARDFINAAHGGKYNGAFTHGLSHQIGLEVHDVGSTLLRKPMKAGMVISNEPGIYVPGFGGARFEDDVLVTAKGNEVL